MKRFSALLTCIPFVILNLASGQAPAGRITPQSASTTVTLLSVSPTTVNIGQTVTFTAAISPGTPTGKVTFYSGTTVLGLAPVSANTATFTTSLMPPGMNSVYARYDGDVNGLPSVSATQTVTVNALVGGGFAADGLLTAGNNPVSVAFGDLNKDGIVDLVTANQNDNTISVFLGSGHGSFQNPSIVNVGTSPSSVAFGDFNGDGFMDLAVTNQSSGTVSILLGKGDGTFQSPGTYNAGAQPRAVALGDFNRDGYIDLAIANTSTDTITILLGTGNGTFGAPASNPLNGDPKALVVADFTGDGIADIAVANYTSGVSGVNYVSLLVGKGDGTFNSVANFPAGVHPLAIAAGDFNGDGKLDIAVANSGNDPSSSVGILLGNNDGSFQAMSTLPGGASAAAVYVGDFNGDGDMDIVVANQSSNTVTVLLNNANAGFQPAVSYPVGTAPLSLVVADFSGDSRQDIAIANSGSANVTILIALTQSTTSLSASPNPASPGQSVNLMATVSPSSATGSVTFMNGSSPIGTVGLIGGSASLSTSTLPAGSNSLTAVYSGDPNYAPSTSPVVIEKVEPTTTTSLTASPASSTFGQAVVFTASVSPSSATGSVEFYDGVTLLGIGSLTGGQAIFSTALLSAGVHSVIAKYSGDAFDLPSVSAPFTVTVTSQAGGGFGAPQSLSTGNTSGVGALSIAMGDVNADGIPDLAVVNAGSNTVSVLLGAGSGAFQPPTLYSVGSSPSMIAVGDFNADGKQDLVVTNTISGTVSVLLGNGNGTFNTVSVNSPAGSSPAALTVGDFNGDGFPDVALVNGGSNQISVLFGNGDGSFQAAVPYTASAPASITSADLNHDGRPDLIVSVGTGIAVLLANSNGTFQTAVSYSTGSGTAGLAVADFNADGNPDVAVVNTILNSVSILTGKGDGTFNTTVNTYPVGGFPQGVTTADFNGDGKIDIAVANEADSTVTLLLGNGDGTFTANFDYAAGSFPASLVAGPFKGDGRAGLAVADLGANSVSLLFALLPSSLSLAASPNPDTNDAPITLTATVSPSAGTGSVTFYDGSAVVGTQGVSDGVASVVVSLLPGTHTLTSKCTGDTIYGPSISNTVTEIVGQGPTTVAVNATPNPAMLGQTVTLTGSVSNNTATGSMTFYDGQSILGVGNVVNGSSTLATGQLSAGLHQLTVRYGGDSNFGASLSSIFTQTIQAQPAYSLTTANSYTIGAPPVAVAAGDFNKDGKTDLIVAESGVTLLRGNGDGTFQILATLTAGTGPSAVAFGDFNRDGNPDIVVTNSGSANVSVFLGNGDGTFGPATNFATGNGPSAITVADLNKDGIADLIVTNKTDGNISILLGIGDGTFNAQSRVTVGVSDVAVVAADFNSDSIADLAVLDASANQVWTLIGNGDGTFQIPHPLAAGTGVTGLVTGDVNGDGRADLLVSDSTGNSISVFLGNGDGTFQGPVSFAAGGAAQAIALGDFDGDGKIDAAVAIATGALNVMRGDGAGNFGAPVSFTVGTNPVALAIANFNGDGKTQAAVVNQGSSSLSILLDGAVPLTIAQGGTQSTPVGSTFPTNLGVSATSYGGPASGVSVSFSAPVTGPGGTFSGSGATATVLTDATGLATAPPFTANGLSGAYQVTATAGVSTVSFSLTNSSSTCTYGVSAPSFGFDNTGGFGALTITPNNSSCSWGASSDSSWITLTNAAGVGTGTITVTVAANTTGVSRTGNILIGGQLIPVAESGTAQVFVDVPPSAYYFDAVNMLYASGVTAGCGPLMYCPSDLITRAQMAVFIVRSVYGGDDFTYSSTPYFTDVPTGSFGFAWIQKMYELGITTGCGTGVFCPSGFVTRDEMAVFLIRARYGSTAVFTYPLTPYFSDVPGSYWAFSWIQRMRLDNITTGCGVNLYCPTSDVTRGDMAIFIERGMFNQLLPSGTPIITSVSPNSTPVGSTVLVTITGVNTNFLTSQTQLSPIPNVTIGTIIVNSSTSLSVQLTVSGSAPSDTPVSLVAITGDEQAVSPNGLLIQ